MMRAVICTPVVAHSYIHMEGAYTIYMEAINTSEYVHKGDMRAERHRDTVGAKV